MKSPLTTNGVRRKLVEAGAVNPSRRAVEIVASQTHVLGQTTFWELNYLPYQLKQAISACSGIARTESEAAFSKALSQICAPQSMSA